MTTTTQATIQRLADHLITAAYRADAIRSVEQDGDIAIKIIREEMKAFLLGERYANERDLALVGFDRLATASLTATCIARIVAERDH